MDRRGRRLARERRRPRRAPRPAPGPLVIPAGQKARPGLEDRRLHRGGAQGQGPRPFRARRPPHAHPTRLLRRHRTAANAGGSRRLCRRPLGSSLRRDGRPPAGLAPFRREMGEALARRRPLRGVRRLRDQSGAPQRLALPRLRHPGPQRRPALRPLHPRAAGRRPARSRHRHRLPRGRSLGPGEIARPRADGQPAGGRTARHDRDDRVGLPRNDARLRALPRPQVRSAPDDRLLCLHGHAAGSTARRT